jgi:ABC-2 type transport system ATP-binding protein
LSPIMIRVSELCKTYRGLSFDNKESGIVMWFKHARQLTSNKANSIKALDSVSFHVEPGEILGIYGANGAGKTTLIKILSGLLEPDSGEVRLNGQTGRNRIKDQISYISTNGWMGLEWQLTARENLHLYGQIFGLNRTLIKERSEKLLHDFDLIPSAEKRISQLSAGMRQKITLARGFLLDRSLLYLDEPTVSLDVPSSTILRDILARKSSEEGKTILIASHNEEDLSLCNRIIMLSKGQVTALGKQSDLQQLLAGQETWEITAQIKEISLAEKIQEDLSLIPGVNRIALTTGDEIRHYRQFTLFLNKGHVTGGNLVDPFLAHNIPVRTMKSRQPSLEEIYNTTINKSVVL